MKSYKDSAAYKGREPLRIERTNKRAGDVVLKNATMPAIIIPGRKGRFAGYMA